MTKIKLCGLTRSCDIAVANELLPDYIGFVFARKSKRYIDPEQAKVLRVQLKKEILPVGVFVDEAPEVVADLLNRHIIEAAQLHGSEEETYIKSLRKLTKGTIIKAVQIRCQEDVEKANASSADLVLLDSGGGSGAVFDWTMLKEIKRPYFLAGGLTPENVGNAVKELKPFGVDASSSLETDGGKDREKMAAFVQAVRNHNKKG